MNYSRQREIIHDALRQNVVHPTAEYLYDVLKKTEPNLSLATLYRNLNQLADNGLIKKIEGLEASAHFDHNTHEHYHFICDKCQKVFDIDADVAPDLVKITEDKTGFLITGHDITFHGLCKDCKETISKN